MVAAAAVQETRARVGKKAALVLPVRPARSAARRRAKLQGFGRLSYDKAGSWSGILLRAIQRDFGGSPYFTREDLLHLREFQHIGTQYRYGLISSILMYMIDQGSVIAKTRTNLCLSGNQAKSYREEPVREQYHDTIVAIIRKAWAGHREAFTVMDVVGEWKTDPHLTVNIKRVAIRESLPKLIRDKVVRRRNEFEFNIVRNQAI
jgi:hypothetical protein